jgi:hypothetical protein
MKLTKEQRDLVRWERKAAARPDSREAITIRADLRLADAAARVIMERRPHLTRERAEQVRDRLCKLRIAKRNREDREAAAADTELWWRKQR